MSRLNFLKESEEKKRVQELLRLTRNTDLCTPVHFDFNHEHIVVEKKQDSVDRFQIKCYFWWDDKIRIRADAFWGRNALEAPALLIYYNKKDGKQKTG